MVWTKEAEKYLKDNYAVLGAKFCAEYLNKTKGSIYEKAKRMGLQGKSLLKTHEQYLVDLNNCKNILVYPVEKYKGARTKILHKCINGHEFTAVPYAILASTSTGCNFCSQELLKTTHEEYVKKSPFIVLEEYIGSNTSILHECLEGHVWSAIPSQILRGRGCPGCAKSGFDNDKPGILYYIKIIKDNLTYYKIGITNRTVAIRFREEKSKNTIIRVIQEIHYDKGLDARAEEKRLLQKYRSYRQNIPELLVSGGNTELFEFDVLGLDK
jgi:hypothetical protein